MFPNYWLYRFVKVISGVNQNKRGTVIAVDGEVLLVRQEFRLSSFSVLTSEVKTID